MLKVRLVADVRIEVTTVRDTAELIGVGCLRKGCALPDPTDKGCGRLVTSPGVAVVVKLNLTRTRARARRVFHHATRHGLSEARLCGRSCEQVTAESMP